MTAIKMQWVLLRDNSSAPRLHLTGHWCPPPTRELMAVGRISWALWAVWAPGSMQQTTRTGLCPSELACERLTKLIEALKALGDKANPLASLSSKSPRLSISFPRWKGVWRISVLSLSKEAWHSRVRLFFFLPPPLCTVLNFSKGKKKKSQIVQVAYKFYKYVFGCEWHGKSRQAFHLPRFWTSPLSDSEQVRTSVL